MQMSIHIDSLVDEKDVYSLILSDDRVCAS